MTLLEWLYDPTPIDGEWLSTTGGRKVKDSSSRRYANSGYVIVDGDCFFVGSDETYRQLPVTTRGEFRRAAELLGIQTKEVRPEDEGDSHESLGFLQQFDWWEVHRSNSGDTHRINMSVRLASGKYVKVYGRVGESPIAAVRRLKSKIAGEQTKGGG